MESLGMTVFQATSKSTHKIDRLQDKWIKLGIHSMKRCTNFLINLNAARDKRLTTLSDHPLTHKKMQVQQGSYIG